MGEFRGLKRFRWTEAKRARVVEVLRETGNVTAAAAAVGARWSTINHQRKKDSAFGGQCKAAIAECDARLCGSEEAFLEGDGFHAIQRTSSGRYQLTAVRKGYWTKRHDDIFFAHLRQTGNIKASAQAAGFDQSTAWDRYYKWPNFRRRWEEVLEEAVVALEFRLICEGSQIQLGPDGRERAAADPRLPATEDPAPDPPLDRDFALKMLKWREEKRHGRRRGPRPKPPSMEEVTAKIVRRVEAIKRHRKLYGGGSGAE